MLLALLTLTTGSILGGAAPFDVVAGSAPPQAPLAVPFVPQRKDTCAAASLAMVLAYWGSAVSHDEIAGRLLQKELHGILGSRLADYARELGFQALAYAGDRAHLHDYIAKGRPLIVALQRAKRRYHNVVVVGFDAGAVLVNDPAVGRARRVPWREFEKRWAAADHWTLLVLPATP